jgi:hypothetical protein
MMKVLSRSSLVATAAAALVSFLSVDAAAQAATTADPVAVDGKGIVGGALLGAELVDITIGIIGVEEAWPYFVFGGVGAVGGAFAGYGVEQATGPATPEPALFMLAGGLTLIVPTLVIALNATSADPPVEEADFPDEPAADPPPAAPGAPPGGGGTVGVGVSTSQRDTPVKKDPARVARRTTAAPAAPRMTAVDLREGDLALGLPAVQVRPLYSSQELARYGVAQGTEVRVPVLGAAF